MSFKKRLAKELKKHNSNVQYLKEYKRPLWVKVMRWPGWTIVFVVLILGAIIMGHSKKPYTMTLRTGEEVTVWDVSNTSGTGSDPDGFVYYYKCKDCTEQLNINTAEVISYKRIRDGK